MLTYIVILYEDVVAGTNFETEGVRQLPLTVGFITSNYYGVPKN